MSQLLHDIINSGKPYNLHTHTQFCDGKESMERIAEKGIECGLAFLGFTPHSPIPICSPCNMQKEDVGKYFDEIKRLKEKSRENITILASMEIDYLNRNVGAHIDYFQKMPLDYRLASVHFVPTQEGVYIDCDGSADRFKKNLHEYFHNDLRYVVEKYYEQVLTMIETGGFDLLGHFDKIAQNASTIDDEIEDYGWYVSLIEDVVRNARDRNLIIEINTKYFLEKNRFFPSTKWWNLLNENDLIAINTDAHQSGKLLSGKEEATELLKQLKINRI